MGHCDDVDILYVDILARTTSSKTEAHLVLFENAAIESLQTQYNCPQKWFLMTGTS
jgi:hypothetical protein